MVKVIVFKKSRRITGEVKIFLATLKDETKLVCSKNLGRLRRCPKAVLKCVPPHVLEMCRDTPPMALFRNSDGEWESTNL